MTHPPERGIFGGWTCIQTRAGNTVRFEKTRGALTIILDGASGELARASLPYPRGGFGGHEFVLSPGEHYLAFFVYSGQSSYGYELFAMPTLEHVGTLRDTRGQGNGPVFSPDERHIAIAAATNSGLVLEAPEHEIDDDGLTAAPCLVDWAELRVQALPRGELAICKIRVRVPVGVPFEGNESFYPERLAFDDGAVSFETEWGERARVALPMPATITIAGPTSRR